MILVHSCQLDALDCGKRLAEIAELKDGWYDGEGKAFDKRRLLKGHIQFIIHNS